MSGSLSYTQHSFIRDGNRAPAMARRCARPGVEIREALREGWSLFFGYDTSRLSK